MPVIGRGVGFEESEGGGLDVSPVVVSSSDLLLISKVKVLPQSGKEILEGKGRLLKVKKPSDLGGAFLGDPLDADNKAARDVRAVFRNIECNVWVIVKSEDYEVDDYNSIRFVRAGVSQIVAPGLTSDPTHAAKLKTIAKNRQAILVCDTPEDKDQAKEYVRDSLNSEWCYPVYDKIKIHKDWDWVDSPALVAGHNQRCWDQYGYHTSPSNRVINGVIDVKNGVEFSFPDVSQNSESTELNKAYVNCIVYTDEGVRLWGNRMSDGKFNVEVTTERAVIKAIQKWSFEAIDRSLTLYFVKHISDSLERFLSNLYDNNVICGYKVNIPGEENTPDQLVNGVFTIDYEIMWVPVAEYIKYRYKNNPEFLKNIFDN